MKPEISIVIPTYNHCEDLLKPCVESIKQFTDLSNIEIVIVANGCIDGTRDYILSQDQSIFKLVWSDTPLGYTKAANDGIDASSGNYILLLNNDTQILPQERHSWINRLHRPFLDDPKMGVTGTKGKECEYTGHWFLIFFCVLIKREVFENIGKLNLCFNPGFGEDTDFCIRAVRAGYKLKEVANFTDPNHYYSDFPIYHLAEGTVHDSTNYQRYSESVSKNIEILKSFYPKLPINVDRAQIVQQTNTKKKISIIIPTYNHCSDLLKPCIESIKKYTDLSNIEIIVSANGCVDETREYVESQDKNIFKLVWSDEASGYTKATNDGANEASGDFIIFLNNDIELLPQETNDWINKLITPFEQSNSVGLTGPMKVPCQYAGQDLIIFFCACTRTAIFNELDGLSLEFSPGYGEDTDFGVRCMQKGYKLVQVPEDSSTYYATNRMTGNFPIFHKGNETFKFIPGNEELLTKNRIILMTKYHPEIKLNLNCGKNKINGFFNADKFERDVDLILDATNLKQFPDNSVSEIRISQLSDSKEIIVQGYAEWIRVLKQNGKLDINILKTDPPKQITITTEIMPEEIEDTSTELPDGWFGEADIATYRKFVSNVPDNGVILEIGTWKGRSICSVADLIIKKNLKVFTIDTYAGTDSTKFEQEAHKEAKEQDLYKVYCKNLKRFGIEERVTSLVGYSHQYPDIFKSKYFDFIFIDADHATEAVKQDIDNWFPKLKPHCVFAGHDIQWASVQQAVGEKFNWQAQHDNGNIWFMKKPMIVDGFTFFNELDILEIRLNELKDVVDRFILVEAEQTHSGLAKPLYFEQNKERFKNFNITHLVAPNIETTDAWVRERAQRDFIKNGWNDLDDNDIVIVSDLDEIPNKKSLHLIFPGFDVLSFDMDMFYYYFNNVETDHRWTEAKITTLARALSVSPCGMRYITSIDASQTKMAPETGWHFSFMGGVEKVIQKIESFAHQEYNNEDIKSTAKEQVEQGKDVFKRGDNNFTELQDLSKLPSYVLENKEKFESYFKTKEIKSKKVQTIVKI